MPATAATGVTQERIALPLITTVQAPHCATPHPYFAPLSPRSLRKTYSNGVSAAASELRAWPLTLIVMVITPPAICQIWAHFSAWKFDYRTNGVDSTRRSQATGFGIYFSSVHPQSGT
jgi:hypothetical protein